MTRRDLIAALSAATFIPAIPSRARSAPPPLPSGTPHDSLFIPEKLSAVATAVEESVAKQGVPGAVLLIGRNGRIALWQAWGNAVLRPEKRPMAPDTLFDLASLTKCVATTTAIAMLFERGKLELDAPAAKYLPAFAEAGGERAELTIRHLLTHTAGVPAGGNYRDRTITLEEILKEIANSNRLSPPGQAFRYSDYSAIALQGIVTAVSGQSLDVFCQEQIFGPLGMVDTGYNPTGPKVERCAATSEANDTLEILGKVHDPTARALGGVSGNAGLFSTADDLARFCQMMLNGGIYGGVRILSADTVRLFTEGQSLTNGARGLGWDRDSSYSVRGNLPVGSYGHTGFTGTSVWIDPTTCTFILLLTNAVHSPGASRVVIPLRRTVSTLVAASMVTPTAIAGSVKGVQTGLEVLVADSFRPLIGRKVGVVCNHTALDRQGQHIVDLMAGSGKVNLISLFGPEHSIRGDMDASADNSKDEKTGLPVYSLYNLTLPREQRYRPSVEQLAGIDTLVFDIQDIGARYYTYIATLGYCLEECAKHRIRVVVLDRPNPLGGELVEGPLLDPQLAGAFTMYHTMPISHGMTVGELARMFNAEKKMGAELEVISLQGWNRKMHYDQTGLPWVNPSPNMHSIRAAWLYPGVGFLETLPLSVGRGTDTPFEILGAPFIDPNLLTDHLNARRLPGVSFIPVRFTPTGSVHKGKICGGIQINLWDRAACKPSALGIHLLDALLRLFPGNLTPDMLARVRGMIGAQRIIDALIAGQSPKDIIASWGKDVDTWKTRRASFLLYR